MFEDKVANFWCTLHIFIKLKNFLSISQLSLLSLLVTLMAILPSSVNVFKQNFSKQRLLLALFNSSMAFFLFSFQVHEKAIILPLTALMFLSEEFHGLIMLMNIVGPLSMSPLLKRDGLIIPTYTTTLFYATIYFVLYPKTCFELQWKDKTYNLFYFIVIITSGFISLELLSMKIKAPTRYPYIWPALISAYSSVLLISCWVFLNFYQIYGLPLHRCQNENKEKRE